MSGVKTKLGLFLQEGQGKMKDKNTVSYTRNNLPKGKTDWKKLKTMDEKDIEKAAKSDSENPRWTEKMFSSANIQQDILIAETTNW
jgi:hypothetical protein